MPKNKQINTDDQQTFIEKCYKDRDGKVAIMQFPNMPIILWAVFRLLSKIIENDRFSNGFSFIANSMLFVWAYLELFSGDSYFRRLLGLIIIIASISANF